MKNLFSKEKTPMEQMADSLDAYSDPCASFIAEGPHFSFGKEAGSLDSVDDSVDRMEPASDYTDSLSGLEDEPTVLDIDVSGEELPNTSEEDDDLGIPEDSIEGELPASENEEIVDKIETIQTELEDLKNMLGESTKEMFEQAFNILSEEFGGQVVPTTGEVNGVPVIEKYQDPSSGEVFVKAEDGRIFCVTIGFGGKIDSVKRTSFNPMIPQAYVRTDSNALSALGVNLAQD